MTGSSADVDNYVTCLQDKRLSTYFIYVATTLYFYDFCLTFGAELCHVWQRRKPSLRNVLYLTARYCGFASAIAGTLPWTTLTLGNAITSLRLITIVASETILVHRTWVLWQHNKFVKRLLVATCIGSLAPCIFVVYEDIISEGVETSRPTPEINADDICSFLVSNATSLWIIPYIMSIFLELVTFLLASFAALLWRERIPSSVRSSLVGILWKDGAMYFGFMAGFSIFNILLVMSVSRPQLRNGGSQLQTLLHSIISSRVVLHLASVLDNSGHPSLSTPRTKLQFASNHRPIEGGSSVYSSSPSSGNPNV
ncbi:hypothetical protein PTI98_010278 [Pleurotus ostreatus]|nr:hypothetical protein PTI98_010278 [Pleurotus ostreatus]